LLEKPTGSWIDFEQALTQDKSEEKHAPHTYWTLLKQAPVTQCTVQPFGNKLDQKNQSKTKKGSYRLN